MSLDPILWALKDAPVADSLERLILVVLAEHAGSSDGCNAFPSRDTMASLAIADPKTVQRVTQRLIKRRLIARGDQSAARYIRADRRPVVYDLLIPYSWFPNPERMNEERRKRGLPPLTPEDRPDIAPAPEKARRKDAGVPRKKTAARGDSKSPREGQGQSGHGGTLSPARGDSQSRTGGLEDPRTSSMNHPSMNHPSLSPAVAKAEDARGRAKAADKTDEREMMATPTDKPTTALPSQRAAQQPQTAVSAPQQAATALDSATRVVRAAGLVSTAEEAGFIAWATTRHQPRTPAWWRTVAKQGDLPELVAAWRSEAVQGASRPAVGIVLPPWCGQCDGEEVPRRWREDDQGRHYRCPVCHPNAMPAPVVSREQQQTDAMFDRAMQRAQARDARPLPGTDTKVAGWLALADQLAAEDSGGGTSW